MNGPPLGSQIASQNLTEKTQIMFNASPMVFARHVFSPMLGQSRVRKSRCRCFSPKSVCDDPCTHLFGSFDTKVAPSRLQRRNLEGSKYDAKKNKKNEPRVNPSGIAKWRVLLQRKPKGRPGMVDGELGMADLEFAGISRHAIGA